MPLRLAVAARYEASDDHLARWAALASELGVKLGVRLVKGSFVEAAGGAVNGRRALLDRYKRLISAALARSDALDVAVATQNEEVWLHARAEAARRGVKLKVHAIRGVSPKLQARMRAAGELEREYVSYGVDTPVMALMEWWTNWRARRALRRRGETGLD